MCIRDRNYSVNDIISRYKSPQNHILVLDYMRMQIEQLRTDNRLGTAKNYEKTMCSFGEFLGDIKLPLPAMTEQVIAAYNVFLIRRGLVRNSVSFYMRVLRAVYNKAVRQKLIEQTHPFTEVYTGIDRTRKRAVAESVMTSLYRLELPEGSPLALTRDLFIFSSVSYTHLPLFHVERTVPARHDRTAHRHPRTARKRHPCPLLRRVH